MSDADPVTDPTDVTDVVPDVAKPSVMIMTSDGKTVTLDGSIADKCGTIKSLLEDMDDNSDVITTIPLPNVTSKTLNSIVKYLTYHMNAKNKSSSDVQTWDKEFVLSHSNAENTALITSSNYLDIPVLKNLVAKVAVVDRIKGKTPEEIRQIFGIENDFDPEEEKELLAQYAWAMPSLE